MPSFFVSPFYTELVAVVSSQKPNSFCTIRYAEGGERDLQDGRREEYDRVRKREEERTEREKDDRKYVKGSGEKLAQKTVLLGGV